MPVVLDDAAAAAGFIGLSVTLFAGCVKGFTILSDAWRFGQDASIVRCLLEVEQHRLNAWADTVGLLDDHARLPFDPKDILVVRSILESLASLLSDVQKLRRQYNLHLEVTSEEIKQLDVPNTAFGQLMFRAKPKFYQQTARVFRNRNGPWTRLRWVVVDVDRARKLTEHIGSMIGHLERFLPKSQSDALVTSVEGMMRLMIVLSTDVQDLKAIAQRQYHGSDDGAVAATALCKQEGLTLGVLHRCDTTDSTSSTLLDRSTSSLMSDDPKRDYPIDPTLRLKTDLVKVTEADGPSSPRTLARYNDDPVLVEWKYTGDGIIPKVRYRIERVTAFLNGLVHPSFHSLRCRGYFRDSNLDRYGYVFNLPQHSFPDGHVAVSRAAMPYMQTLKDRLRNGSAPPSLNDRLSLAIALTETVLQLHTSGFLHKEIRSENILFFHDSHDITSKYHADADTAPPYLAGYVYARADNPLEATENPEVQFDPNLYRHPLSLGSRRASYRKTFDLFSLGCVLLELGLWSRLSAVLLQAARTQQQQNPKSSSNNPGKKQLLPAASVYAATNNNIATAPNQGQGVTGRPNGSDYYRSILNAKEQLLDPVDSIYFRRLLEASAGKSYANVVMACLHAEATRKSGGGNQLDSYDGNGGGSGSSSSSSDDDDDDIADYTLDIQEASLAQLRSISI